MNPFFFGDSKEPLFGVYHPPTSSPSKQEAILLCPPFGQEYMRSHRAYRQLAVLLNKKGYGVLRFDYKGTGDSFGEDKEASIQDWLANITLAAKELKETAQVSKLSIVGLRLGGLLASYASAEIPDVQSLILWDTIVSGQRYTQELQDEMPEQSKSNFLSANGDIHFNGYTLFAHQIEDLTKLDLSTLVPPNARIVQLCSSESPNQNILKESWGNNDNFEYALVPAPGDWNFVDDFGGILLPQQIIQAIVGYFN